MAKEFNVLSIICHMAMPAEKAKKEAEKAFEWGVDAIVGQSNSTDWGPYWLGDPDCHMLDRAQVSNNMNVFIKEALDHKVPFAFSLGTPSGSNKHLDECLDDIDKFARENNLHFKIALVRGEVSKDYILNKLKNGEKFKRVIDSDRLPEYLSEKDVEEVNRIVAQMGPEPIMKALQMDVDGVITGRALDVGLHMAPLLNAGFDKGTAAHMAKTIECAGVCLDGRQGFTTVYATIGDGYFKITTPNEEDRASIKSVAGHSLFERRNPFREENPGGYLDLMEAVHEQIDDKTVKVSGGKWQPVEPYTVKVEGAKLTGYRCISIVGIREEKLLGQLDSFLETMRKKTDDWLSAKNLKAGEDYNLNFRIYGTDGVLGKAEKVKTVGHEVGLIIEGSGRTQEIANEVVEYTYGHLAYGYFPGRKSTSNCETPYAPHFYQIPPDYRFNVWHLMPLEDPCEPFDIEVMEFPRNK